MSCHHLVYYIIIYIEPFGGINNVQNKHCLPTPMFAGWKQLCLLTVAGDVNPFHPFWQGWKDLVSVHWPLLTSGTCSCSTLWAREPSTCKGCSMSSWQGWKDLVSVIAPVWQGALVAAAPFWQGSQAPVEGQLKILAHVFPELYGLCLCQIFFFQLLLDVCNDLLVLLCPFGRHFHNKVQFFAVLGGSACDVRSWDRLVGITNPQLHPRCPASRQSHLLARWLGSRHFQNLSILLARFGTTFFFFAFFFLPPKPIASARSPSLASSCFCQAELAFCPILPLKKEGGAASSLLASLFYLLSRYLLWQGTSGNWGILWNLGIPQTIFFFNLLGAFSSGEIFVSTESTNFCRSPNSALVSFDAHALMSPWLFNLPKWHSRTPILSAFKLIKTEPLNLVSLMLGFSWRSFRKAWRIGWEWISAVLDNLIRSSKSGKQCIKPFGSTVRFRLIMVYASKFMMMLSCLCKVCRSRLTSTWGLLVCRAPPFPDILWTRMQKLLSSL